MRVSLICFSPNFTGTPYLDGEPVQSIHSNLTASTDADGIDLTKANPLIANSGIAFIGTQKNGEFDIVGDVARSWLQSPINPNGKNNSEVVRPWANGMDITRRPSDTWIVDFGVGMTEADAALFELPFQHTVEKVKPFRENLRRDGHRIYWWRYGESRPGMRKALRGRSRFIVTPRVAKHRFFVWLDSVVVPDSRLCVLARDDDTTFGILQSHFHEIWSLATCSWHGKGNDPTYNAQSCFETFPFPDGLTPNIPAADYASDPRAIAIATAAKRLNELRENWLNPPDLVVRVPEVVAGYPDRIIPKDAAAAVTLKNRTLTKLYNQRPAWLDNAHRDLDAAVAAAYGWPADISDDDALAKLLELNLRRARE